MRSIFVLFVWFYCVLNGTAQLVNAPSGDNQICEVTQYLGSIANVSVKYSSPGVKGRSGKIWGSLVPWGMEANNIGSAKEIPWRAGANEKLHFHLFKFPHTKNKLPCNNFISKSFTGLCYAKWDFHPAGFLHI